MPTLRVTKQAKDAAKEALKEREIASDKFGLSEKEAKKQGIESGVARAHQLIRKDKFDWENPEEREDLKSMAAFYSRFQNCYSDKCEGSMKLWGGRWWLRNKVVPFVNKHGGYNY